MKVLITAFKPFNNEKINHSSEVLKYLQTFDNIILDVIYDECYQELTSKYNLNDYELIISLGEARSRNELTLETQAWNLSSCSLKDNKGNLFKDLVINPDFDETLKTKVNIDCCKELIKFSFDAGKFVCNNLYFHLLMNFPEKAIFIHIPESKQEDYTIHAETIIKIINAILK